MLDFELVLANSSIVNANQAVNPDLFWALKGGGNNFGIVTKVTLDTFHDPPTIYTFQLFNIKDLSTVFNRLQMHTATMPVHVWQIATTLGWHVPAQNFVISERMVASQRPELPERIFRKMTSGSFEASPVLQTNVYERSILAMAQKMDGMNKSGFFNFFGSITINNSAQLCEALARIFQEEVELIKHTDGLHVYIVYNPLTLNAMQHMGNRGGNALGLLEQRSPLLGTIFSMRFTVNTANIGAVVNINLHWSDESAELQMRSFMQRLIGRFRQTAKAAELLHRYVFQNHAFEEQDVFPGYGEANYARLKAVRISVDPDSVFQELQPGYFKLEKRVSEAVWEKSEL